MQQIKHFMFYKLFIFFSCLFSFYIQKLKSIITWSFDNIWQAMWKVELSLFFFFPYHPRGAKTILVFALHGRCCQFTPMTSEDTTEAGSVHHFNGARPLDCNTEQIGRGGGAAPNDPNEFVWWNHAVVDLQTVALKHPWFHTCVINTNTLTTVKKYLWLSGCMTGRDLRVEFLYRELSSKQIRRANTNFSRHLHSDGSHLGGRLVSVVWVQNNQDLELLQAALKWLPSKFKDAKTKE